MSSAPPFGTASAYTDSFPAPPPKALTISAETCFNLSVFKDIVRQYRKLDDQVVTRLNRAQAQLRDEARAGKGSSPEGMCAKMWSEMMAGWLHRQTLITYCQQTVDASLAAKRAATAGVEDKLAAPPPRKAGVMGGVHERGIGEETVIVEQIANEASIEAIVRKRTLEVFKSRCPFFVPTGASKGWWELAENGRAGQGPDV